MKKILLILSTLLLFTMLVGCGAKTEEIKLPELDKKLDIDWAKLDTTTYKETVKKDVKTIDVKIAFNAEIMRIGTVKSIRQTIENELSDDYSEIKLKIVQQEPSFDSVYYTYKDGAWDKEVE